MPRLAPKITLDELKDKLSFLFKDDDEGNNFPYNLPEKVNKDLAKIQFDFENYFIGNADESFEEYPSDCTPGMDYPCGYEILPNGIPVLFIAAGGDWEYPVCFCLYWDGKGVRGYIPKNGNVYDTKTKQAYGNDDDKTLGDIEEEINLDEKANAEQIREDVMNRIQVLS